MIVLSISHILGSLWFSHRLGSNYVLHENVNDGLKFDPTIYLHSLLFGLEILLDTNFNGIVYGQYKSI